MSLNLSPEEYLSERVEDQIEWYDKKSIKFQRRYKYIKLIQMTSISLVPLLAGYAHEQKLIPYIIAGLGFLSAILEGILSLRKYHENWIEYRRICELLKNEKYMFRTNSGIYNTPNNFQTFVERIEQIISDENINWASSYSNNSLTNTNSNTP